MDHQQLSDQIEIQQLCARYMMLSARKDNDHWTEVFTEDGAYNAFGTPYGLDHFPMLLKSAPPGQYIGNPPVVEFDGDTATGVQHYVFIDQTSHEMRLAWYDGRVRAHRRRLAHPIAFHHLHAPQRRVRPRQRARPRRASSPAKRSSRAPCASASWWVPRPAATHAKVDQMVGDAKAADEAGFATAWIPQLPQDFDAMTAVALMGRETSRIELGTAVVPLQSRHPIALGQQALSVQAACDGRFRLGVGPSHHWIVDSMLGSALRAAGASWSTTTSTCSTPCSTGPNPVDVENDQFRIHNPLDVTDLPVPVFLAALGPVMLRLAGERAAGTVLWMADERAIAEHVVPKITKAAEDAGRPAPRVVAGRRGVPVRVRARWTGAIERANDALGHAEYSPNYQRLLERGDVGRRR